MLKYPPVPLLPRQASGKQAYAAARWFGITGAILAVGFTCLPTYRLPPNATYSIAAQGGWPLGLVVLAGCVSFLLAWIRPVWLMASGACLLAFGAYDLGLHLHGRSQAGLPWLTGPGTRPDWGWAVFALACLCHLGGGLHGWQQCSAQTQN